MVAARELSLQELSRMHEACPIEIEAFVHGALCYSYSGQCLMSSLWEAEAETEVVVPSLAVCHTRWKNFRAKSMEKENSAR